MADSVTEKTLIHDTNSIPYSLFDDDNFYNSISDHALFRNSISDLRLFIDGDEEFELNLDIVDDLYFPSENESFVVPIDTTNRSEISSDFVLSTSGCCNRDSDCSDTTQISENFVFDVSEATIASSSPESEEMVVDYQKLKVEEEEITKKRRKEEDTSRNVKYRRLNYEEEEDDEKRNVRLIRNRESAQLSRQRKKHYVEELEEKVKKMEFMIMDLNSKVSYFVAENVALRQQLGLGSGMCRSPLVPVAYQWLHCPGSQVPLLPIPRLKPPPQQSVANKVKRKMKKVASVSVLGFLFCLFLFGALAPIVNVRYSDRVYDHSRGRVLDVFVDSNRESCGRDFDQGVGRNVSVVENFEVMGNGSEHLVASLFVPRNDKLVKIDGNLIIHSVLASEKAKVSETKNNEGESSVATSEAVLPLPEFTRTRDLSKHLYSEKRKALLSSGSDDTLKDQLESTTANGDMQQWFREGVAGPMFSSGMCTEVFQFDVSSTSGAIIPASPATKQPKNATDTHKGKKNRRILRGGLPVSDFSLTKDQNSSSKENFQETKPGPSMVVSVLVDPREGGDGDIDGMIGRTKSLSRVFIVLLVDGVKYVTYSCVLPQPQVPHIVTT
ncbi:hypothetical protein AALP_AA5G209200 [Arabis alpina]|uniref:BZIP domain-containing protein n=1 Tax=Arabis alpina TaxID=50452 RepID=A0A087GYF5_ARAAL|nr:hypothetical protein AALP_AA5G209200 [Arabis alpina]